MAAPLDRQTILAALHELDSRDPQRKLFGAAGHAYRLRPPLPSAELADFEAEHRVTFPPDYKYFITEIADGGAGPYYGVFPFGQQDDLRGYCAWANGQLVGDMAKPFPHLTDWNLPDSFWALRPDPGPDISLQEEDRLMAAWDKLLDEKYWNPALVNGALPICHLGCALRQWLVISGEQRGFVWRDDRADEKGLYPSRDRSGAQMTFSDWYMSWLNEALEEVGSNRRTGAHAP